VTLDSGREVQIVQQLGTSITVRTELGTLLRVDGADAGALGLESPTGACMGASTGAPTSGATATFDMDLVIDALRGIYDPEIPVSIVELGLVYRCEEVSSAGGGRRIEIDMSMTAPGCGMGDVLRADAIRAVQALPGVDEVEVTLVWDPPWTIHLISEAARLQLGLL
jgi:probable FeS assembly SUF system protein SufT